MNTKLKTSDELIKSKLRVSIYAHPTAACPDENDPSTAKTHTVSGLDAARDWLSANGGYASLKADYRDGMQITGWTVYRVFPGFGHRAAGYISPVWPEKGTAL